MATVVEKNNPANQASLKVDENGNLLVVLKGGGGGPAPDLSNYYTKAQVDSKLAALPAPGGPTPASLLAGTAWYDRHNSQDGGGTGASLATKAPVTTGGPDYITFAPQTTVTVSKAGWYRVSLTVASANVAQTGFYLNNAVTQFTKHMASEDKQFLMGKDGACSFLAYFSKGVAHRISLNTPTTQQGQGATLTIEYVGP